MFNRLKFNKLVQAKKDLNLLNFRHYMNTSKLLRHISPKFRFTFS